MTHAWPSATLAAMDMPGPQGGPSPSEPQDVAVGPAAERTDADEPPAAVEPAVVVEAPAAGTAATAGTGAPAATAADGSQSATRPRRHRRLLYVTLPGCWGALIAGCLSVTP